MSRNWSEICNITENSSLRIALSVVDPDSGVGSQLRTAHPHCFNDAEVNEQLPLSAITNHMCIHSHAMDLVIEPTLVHFKVPYVCFAVTETALNTDSDSVEGLLPRPLRGMDLHRGSVVTFWYRLTMPDGAELPIKATLIVVSVDEEEVILAPIERVSANK